MLGRVDEPDSLHSERGVIRQGSQDTTPRRPKPETRARADPKDADHALPDAQRQVERAHRAVVARRVERGTLGGTRRAHGVAKGAAAHRTGDTGGAVLEFHGLGAVFGNPLHELPLGHRESRARLMIRRGPSTPQEDTRLAIAHEHFTPADLHGRSDHIDDRGECLPGTASVERFRTEHRESIDLDGTRLSGFRLGTRTIQQVGGDDTRAEKREQDQPIERIGDVQRTVRQQKEPVEQKEGDGCDDYAKGTARIRARAQHDEQIHHRHVGFVEPTPNQHHCDRCERECGHPTREPDETRRPRRRDVTRRTGCIGLEHPPTKPLRQATCPKDASRHDGRWSRAAGPGAPRYAAVGRSKRYPTPGSVRMRRGRTGSSSSLRRRLRT